MRIAKEGYREIAISTVLLGAGAWVCFLYFWPAALLFVAVWAWAVLFFRDPKREATFQPGELCAPADGTITEISTLEHDELIGGPAIRIGIFLSVFSVHANRAACDGTVKSIEYKPGRFLDARHPESGRLNESNTVVFDTDAPIIGPVVVRQVAGMVARRIVSHAKVGDHMPIGHRFGMIKFGSRTELIIPQREGTEVAVKIGQPVRAGLTVMARTST